MGNLLRDFGRGGKRESGSELFTQLLRDIGHLVERTGLLGENPFADLLGAKRGLTELFDEIGDFLLG